MVWGGISLTARTDLHVFNRGSVNSHTYISDILAEYVLPFAPYIGENFLLMQDNVKPHAAHVVTEYLDHVGIRVMEWPARSPDLNPVEHLWNTLGRRIKALHPPLANIHELGQRLIEIWNDLNQEEVIRPLILSMARR